MVDTNQALPQQEAAFHVSAMFISGCIYSWSSDFFFKSGLFFLIILLLFFPSLAAGRLLQLNNQALRTAWSLITLPL